MKQNEVRSDTRNALLTRDALLLVAPVILLTIAPDIFANFLWSLAISILGYVGLPTDTAGFINWSESLPTFLSSLIAIFLIWFFRTSLPEQGRRGGRFSIGALLLLAYPLVHLAWVMSLFGYLAPTAKIGLGFTTMPQQLPLIVAFGFVVPIAEEILYRHWLFAIAREKLNLGVGLTALFVAVIWSLIHLPSTLGYLQFLLLLPFGLVLSLARQMTGGIGLPVLIHCSTNLLFCILPTLTAQELLSILHKFLPA